MAPELMFLSERAPQLLITAGITDSKAKWLLHIHYTVLQSNNNTRSASAINPVTTENTDDSHL